MTKRFLITRERYNRQLGVNEENEVEVFGEAMKMGNSTDSEYGLNHLIILNDKQEPVYVTARWICCRMFEDD